MPGPGQFTHTTAIEAREQLRVRLFDTGVHRFWNDGELAAGIREAQRVWQALTASFFHRTEPIPLSTDRLALVDLHSTALPFSITDFEVSVEMCWHLLEYTSGPAPPDPSMWTGTGQFNWEVILQALNRRMHQFLFETGCSVRHLPPVAVPPSPISRVDLPQSVIDVRRVAWLRAEDDEPTVLDRETEHAADSFSPEWWDNPTVPYAYSTAATPGLSMQLIPPPSVAGRLDICAVATPTPLTNLGVIVEVPTDFVWAVKWGAMADLLGGSGRAADPVRQKYAEDMYRIGAKVAMLNPSVKRARVNDVPVDLDTVHSLDQFRPGWQTDAPGTPFLLGMLGRNLLAPYPIPDVEMSTTLDLVSNAPVYETHVQVGREILDAILDYAQHLAMFKIGGQELMLSFPLRDNLIRLAEAQNKRIAGLLDKLYMNQPGQNFDRQTPSKI